MNGTGPISWRWSWRYSQARTGQPMSTYRQRSGSRLPAAGFCLGAVALLYGGSFYTRDWRLVIHRAGQPVTAPVSARSALEARPLSPHVKPSELPARVAVHTARVEPEVTGALPKGPDPLAAPLQPRQLLQPVQGRLALRQKYLRLMSRRKLRLRGPR